MYFFYIPYFIKILILYYTVMVMIFFFFCVFLVFIYSSLSVLLFFSFFGFLFFFYLQNFQYTENSQRSVTLRGFLISQRVRGWFRKKGNGGLQQEKYAGASAPAVLSILSRGNDVEEPPRVEENEPATRMTSERGAMLGGRMSRQCDARRRDEPTRRRDATG